MALIYLGGQLDDVMHKAIAIGFAMLTWWVAIGLVVTAFAFAVVTLFLSGLCTPTAHSSARFWASRPRAGRSQPH